MVPSVLTASELGISLESPGFSGGFWAPVGTSKDIVNLLGQSIEEIARRPDVRQALRVAGAEAVEAGPKAFAGLVQKERVFWSRAAKESGFVPE